MNADTDLRRRAAGYDLFGMATAAAGGMVLSTAPVDVPLRRKVFISHSANGDPFAARVRDLLAARLRERAYEVLVDTDGLVPGQDWGPQLYRWLDECHAAVLLLTGKALASPWVHREAHILLWRRALNPAFTVVPALLAIGSGPVREAGLSELTPVQAARCDGTADSDVTLVVERILTVLPPTLPDLADDPMRRWLRGISRTLHLIPHFDRDVLREAGRHLDLPDDPDFEWGHEEACRLVAAQLLGQGLQGRRLELALTKLSKSLDADPFGRLTLDSLPSWVDASAARLLLPPEPGTEPDRMTVFLDLSTTDLAVDYIARAMCREVENYECLVITALPSGESPADDLLTACRALIREELALGPNDLLGPDTLRPEGKVHYLVLDPGEIPGEAVLEAASALHDDCPWLVIILLGGGQKLTPGMLTAAGFRNAVPVEPSLTPADEHRARQLRRAVTKIMEKRYGRQESSL